MNGWNYDGKKVSNIYTFKNAIQPKVEPVKLCHNQHRQFYSLWKEDFEKLIVDILFYLLLNKVRALHSEGVIF